MRARSDAAYVRHAAVDCVTQLASTRAILARYPGIAGRFPPLREALERGDAILYTQCEAWLALWHGKTLPIARADDGRRAGNQGVCPEARSIRDVFKAP